MTVNSITENTLYPWNMLIFLNIPSITTSRRDQARMIRPSACSVTFPVNSGHPRLRPEKENRQRMPVS